MKKLIYLNLVAFTVSVLFCSAVSADSMGGGAPSSEAFYLGVFGGGGNLTTGGNVSQLGTAFTANVAGGALGVNASGKSPNATEWAIGGTVGYRWSSRESHLFGMKFAFSPATELEGYYIGGATLKPTLNNPNPFLSEHRFNVTLPLRSTVVLVSGVVNIDHALFSLFHPYIGVGVGIASTKISGGFSEQITPAEAGLNHFNSNDTSSGTALAIQPKVGLSYKLSENSKIFLEYRLLYLTAMNFEFGNTTRTDAHPTHPITTNWTVQLPSQYYNMGTVGIQFNL